MRVQLENGSVETIRLDGTWQIVAGKLLDRIRSDRGMEHFFTKDGYYDGWGANVCEATSHAGEIVSAMEQKRRFDPD